jgi:hypothetical protein
MKNILFFSVLVIMIGGCATPKIGKDIIIEPQGNLRLETSKADIAMEILSVMGLPASSRGIRLGSDVKISNHWKSDITLHSLTYVLTDTHSDFASGEVTLDASQPIIIAPNTEKSIPLTLLIEPTKLSITQLAPMLESKQPLYLQGTATIEVWGFKHHYTFDKDIGEYLTKALIDKIYPR